VAIECKIKHAIIKTHQNGNRTCRITESKILNNNKISFSCSYLHFSWYSIIAFDLILCSKLTDNIKCCIYDVVIWNYFLSLYVHAARGRVRGRTLRTSKSANEINANEVCGNEKTSGTEKLQLVDIATQFSKDIMSA